MKIIRGTSFLTALTAAVLLTGCGSSGIDILGGGSGSGSNRGTYDPYVSNDVQGTVERVNTRDRFIVVENETEYRSNLRNDDDRYGNGNEVVLYYDERTSVEYGGRTYNPEDLEVGDRIRADVEQTGSRLMAEQIEVLRDATSGSSSSSAGTYNDDLRSDELRGTVRYLDTRNRTLEIEPSRYSSNFSTGSATGSSGSSNVVVVHYDTETIVEFNGRRYSPENLERGDTVEIELRELGGRYLAEEILVVGDARSGR